MLSIGTLLGIYDLCQTVEEFEFMNFIHNVPFFCFSTISYLSLTSSSLIFTSLAEEVMFLVALVSLFVCLSADNIT